MKNPRRALGEITSPAGGPDAVGELASHQAWNMLGIRVVRRRL